MQIESTKSLTTGIDQGALWVGGLNNDVYYGLLNSTAGVATLNTFDSIDGAGGVNTLSLTDTVTTDASLLPSVTLANIQKVIVQTAGALGVSSSSLFDVSVFPSVTDLTVTSTGTGADFVNAGAAQHVTITATGGNATVIGGLADTVTAKGSISVNGATGAVSATVTGTSSATVGVTGGTTVTVASKGTGVVSVGGPLTADRPTGAVTVTDTGAAATPGTTAITVLGGTTVGVTAAGKGVVVGGAAAASPSGAVTVTQSGVVTGGANGAVSVDGGTTVVVNTTGGNVRVGGTTAASQTKPTGAISVVDSNNTITNADTIAVVGGTTATVTAGIVKGAGSITVGSSAATLNAAGTALLAPTNYASDTVTVANSVTTGTAVIYGGSTTTNVYANGATSVSITGAKTGGAITDLNTTLQTGGAAIGTVVGTSKLASVTLNGVSGTQTITSDALTSVTISNSASTATAAATAAANASGRTAATAVTINGSTGQTATHALAVTLSADATGTSVTDNLASSFTVGTTGTTADFIALSGSKATSVTFNNAASLTVPASGLSLKAPTSAITGATITANNTAALVLGDQSGTTGGFANVDAINAAGATGAVTVTIDAAKTTFTGGAGNDVLTIAVSPVKAIAGGGGTNELVFNAAGPFDASANAYISGFTTLGLGGSATGTTTSGYDATGFTALHVAGSLTGAVEFTNVAAGTVLNLDTAVVSQAVTYTLADATGLSDALTINVGLATDTGLTDTNGLTASGIENLTIKSAGTLATKVNTLSVTDAAAQTITITGNAAFVAGSVTGGSAVTSINASANGGAVTLTNLAGSYKSTGVTITGGAGALTATGGAAGATVITTGAGGSTLTVGNAGLTSITSNVLQYAGGTQVFALAASAAKVDTITQIDRGDVAVSGFQAIQTSLADKLNFANAITVLANTASSTATSVTGLNYQSSNGVITFEGAGQSLLSSFTDADLLQAARDILKGTIDRAAIFVAQNGTDSFVVGSSHSTTGNDGITLTKLVGVTGLQGFGSTAASHTVLTTAALLTNTLKGSALTAGTGDTTANHIYDATGYSHTSETEAPLGSTDTTINNLAASAKVDLVSAAALDLYTTQVGAAGTNSLTLGLSTNSVHLGTLNVTGDLTLLVNATTGTKTYTIDSLVDGATTDTLTTVTIAATAAAADFVLKAVSDTALTTVNAGTSIGAFTFGLVGTPISNSGLTITGGTGANTIYASGASDIITAANAASSAAGETVVANGAGTSVTLTSTGTGATGSSGDVSITANGAGATVDVSGWNILTADTGTLAITATGAADTIKLGIGLFGAVWTADIGSNATVYVKAYNTIDVHNDYTGATTAMTTITATASATTGATAATGLIANAYAATDLVAFDSAATVANNYLSAAVNTASATSLATALNLAAVVAEAGVTGGTVDGTHGAIAWFNYGGDTYIVNAVGLGASGTHSTTALDTTDIVVKLTGLADLTSATYTSGAVDTLTLV